MKTCKNCLKALSARESSVGASHCAACIEASNAAWRLAVYPAPLAWEEREGLTQEDAKDHRAHF